MTREEKIQCLEVYCNSLVECVNECRLCNSVEDRIVFEIPASVEGYGCAICRGLAREVSDEVLDNALVLIGINPKYEVTTGEKIREEAAEKIAGIAEETFGKRDMINPDHYKVHANECIDEIEAMLTPEEFRGFLKGNFLKYRYRTGHKDDPEQEAKKSDRYMNKLIQKQREANG